MSLTLSQKSNGERERERVRESTYDEEVRLVFGIKYTLCAMIKL